MSLKIVLYAGYIPSEIFIQRLENGLADAAGMRIYLHGYKFKNSNIHPNIKIIGIKGKTDAFIFLIKYLMLFTFRPRIFLKILKILRREKKISDKIMLWLKAAPIIWIKPHIFHLQWVADIDYWLFLQDFGIKVICSLRGSMITTKPVTDEKLGMKYLECFPSVDGFHAVSRAIGEKARRYGAPAGKIRIIYSGLPLNEFVYYPMNQRKRQTNTFKIVSIGRPRWVKGYSTSLGACEILRNKKFDFNYTIIGGEDEALLYFRYLMGLEKCVRFLPRIDISKVKSLVIEADLILHPSIEEGVSNVVLESMALGTPVLTTDCGGMPEVIKDGFNGWLVPVRNPVSMAERIIEISNLPIEELQKVTSNARNTIEARHSVENMVKEMTNFYASVLEME